MRRPTIAWGEVTIDCLETERVATFWGALLEAPSQGHGQAGWFRVGPLVSGGPVIFQPVSERKAGRACRTSSRADSVALVVVIVFAQGCSFTTRNTLGLPKVE